MSSHHTPSTPPSHIMHHQGPDAPQMPDAGSGTSLPSALVIPSTPAEVNSYAPFSVQYGSTPFTPNHYVSNHYNENLPQSQYERQWADTSQDHSLPTEFVHRQSIGERFISSMDPSPNVPVMVPMGVTHSLPGYAPHSMNMTLDRFGSPNDFNGMPTSSQYTSPSMTGQFGPPAEALGGMIAMVGPNGSAPVSYDHAAPLYAPADFTSHIPPDLGEGSQFISRPSSSRTAQSNESPSDSSRSNDDKSGKSGTKPKKKLTEEEKQAICNEYDRGMYRQSDIAEVYSIDRSTVSKIVKQNRQQLRRTKPESGRFIKVEELLNAWLDEMVLEGKLVTDVQVRGKARDIGISGGFHGFKASHKWWERVRVRRIELKKKLPMAPSNRSIGTPLVRSHSDMPIGSTPYGSPNATPIPGGFASYPLQKAASVGATGLGMTGVIMSPLNTSGAEPSLSMRHRSQSSPHVSHEYPPPQLPSSSGPIRHVNNHRVAPLMHMGHYGPNGAPFPMTLNRARSSQGRPSEHRSMGASVFGFNAERTPLTQSPQVVAVTAPRYEQTPELSPPFSLAPNSSEAMPGFTPITPPASSVMSAPGVLTNSDYRNINLHFTNLEMNPIEVTNIDHNNYAIGTVAHDGNMNINQANYCASPYQILPPRPMQHFRHASHPNPQPHPLPITGHMTNLSISQGETAQMWSISPVTVPYSNSTSLASTPLLAQTLIPETTQWDHWPQGS